MFVFLCSTDLIRGTIHAGFDVDGDVAADTNHSLLCVQQKKNSPCFLPLKRCVCVSGSLQDLMKIVHYILFKLFIIINGGRK